MNRLRVLVVDDSAAFRGALRLALEREPDLEVVAEAGTGERALELVARERPDVVTLDVMMPGMDGIETARAILAARATPIVLLTHAAEDEEQRRALSALALGVVEVAAKPALAGLEGAAAGRALARLVREAAGVDARRRPHTVPPPAAVLAAGTLASIDLVALVASTGGPPVVAELLSGMPAHAPPAVVAQHLSPSLARGFAGWLTRAAGRPVQVVSRPAPLAPGTIYVAEDAHHLRVRADTVEPVQAAPGEIAANGDLLLRSVAASFGARAFAAVLTGMGRDGAAGLRALRDAGGWTVAQDRESSVVHGMPRAAEEAGGCREVLPLALIRARLEQLWQRGGATST